MSIGIPSVGGAIGAERLAPLPEPRPPQETNFGDRFDPAAAADQPPAEVRAEIQAAARCADRLHELGRQLHFERDETSGEIRIEVRDLDGNVLRRVPPSEVFDFADGKAVE
jgi:uncharacterized FlaG/YvyC family protein